MNIAVVEALGLEGYNMILPLADDQTSISFKVHMDEKGTHDIGFMTTADYVTRTTEKVFQTIHVDDKAKKRFKDTLTLPKGDHVIQLVDIALNSIFRGETVLPYDVIVLTARNSISFKKPVKGPKTIHLFVQESSSEITLGTNKNADINFILHEGLSKLNLDSFTNKEVICPASLTHLVQCRYCHIDNLVFKGDVALRRLPDDVSCFDHFDGNITFLGDVSLEPHAADGKTYFGAVKDSATIHVQSEEIAKKIYDSADFNKNAKIYVGDKLFS